MARNILRVEEVERQIYASVLDVADGKECGKYRLDSLTRSQREQCLFGSYEKWKRLAEKHKPPAGREITFLRVAFKNVPDNWTTGGEKGLEHIRPGEKITAIDISVSRKSPFTSLSWEEPYGVKTLDIHTCTLVLHYESRVLPVSVDVREVQLDAYNIIRITPYYA